SPGALHVAQVNAERFGVAGSIRFVRSDLFAELDNNERFDIIASNPPYISTEEYDDLEDEVKADPKLALLAGPRGLDIIVRLITDAPDFLVRPGFLQFEIGYDQTEEIFEMVHGDDRYTNCTFFKDLNDIDRIALCKIE
ncbi:MAG: N5-glutamine methyltransferase family protein, partial [Candidatus Thorarchaeota archaeon]